MVHVHTKLVFFPQKKSVSLGKEGVNDVHIFYVLKFRYLDIMLINRSTFNTFKYSVIYKLNILGITFISLE